MLNKLNMLKLLDISRAESNCQQSATCTCTENRMPNERNRCREHGRIVERDDRRRASNNNNYELDNFDRKGCNNSKCEFNNVDKHRKKKIYDNKDKPTVLKLDKNRKSQTKQRAKRIDMSDEELQTKKRKKGEAQKAKRERKEKLAERAKRINIPLPLVRHIKRGQQKDEEILLQNPSRCKRMICIDALLWVVAPKDREKHNEKDCRIHVPRGNHREKLIEWHYLKLNHPGGNELHNTIKEVFHWDNSIDMKNVMKLFCDNDGQHIVDRKTEEIYDLAKMTENICEEIDLESESEELTHLNTEQRKKLVQAWKRNAEVIKGTVGKHNKKKETEKEPEKEAEKEPEKETDKDLKRKPKNNLKRKPNENLKRKPKKEPEMETSEKEMGEMSEIMSEMKMNETSEMKMDEIFEKEVQENQKLDETIVDATPNDVIEEDKKLVEELKEKVENNEDKTKETLKTIPSDTPHTSVKNDTIETTNETEKDHIIDTEKHQILETGTAAGEGVTVNEETFVQNDVTSTNKHQSPSVETSENVAANENLENMEEITGSAPQKYLVVETATNVEEDTTMMENSNKIVSHDNAIVPDNIKKEQVFDIAKKVEGSISEKENLEQIKDNIIQDEDTALLHVKGEQTEVNFVDNQIKKSSNQD